MLHLIRFLQAHPIHDNSAQFSVIWQGGLQWGGVTAAAPGRDPLSDSGVRCGAGVPVTLVPGSLSDWGSGVLGVTDLEEVPACVSLFFNIPHPGPFSFFSTFFIFCMLSSSHSRSWETTLSSSHRVFLHGGRLLLNMV